jgi:hypothetical protein
VQEGLPARVAADARERRVRSHELEPLVVLDAGPLEHGDGKSDVLWRSTSSGQVFVFLATGTSGTTFQPAYLTTQTSDWQIVR